MIHIDCSKGDSTPAAIWLMLCAEEAGIGLPPGFLFALVRGFIGGRSRHCQNSPSEGRLGKTLQCAVCLLGWPAMNGDELSKAAKQARLLLFDPGDPGRLGIEKQAAVVSPRA
jgi:hypothetical protein